MRFLAIVCLISLLLSVAIFSAAHVDAYSPSCIQPNALPAGAGTPIVPTNPLQAVVLNEVLPSPRTGWNCDYQNTPNARQNAWIELYNLQDQPLDLYAEKTCIDTGPNTQSFCLNPGSIIPAHGFFTLFPYTFSFYTTDNNTQSAFSTLRLLISYDVPVDQVTIPALPHDVSYARVPDGTGTWQQSIAPTINASNNLTGSLSSGSTPLSGKHGSTSKTFTKREGGRNTRKTRVGDSASAIQVPTMATADVDYQTQANFAKQIQWHGLQFPHQAASPSALNAIQTAATTSPTGIVPVENVPQKVLFSLLGVAGLLGLFWGWQRFLKKIRKT